ncbi:Na+/H+ antiporter NhaC family protein [Peptoanaerobacter stomatis]
MFGNVVLILFVGLLVVCISFNIDVIIALLLGIGLFFIYCLKQGMSVKQTLSAMREGSDKIANVVAVFLTIGVLTASWRMSGTIAYIIYKLIPFINPNYFVVATFLLCSAMSMMIGTSFGTAASMGVICMVIAKSMGLNEALVGGAVLSGIYVGDRTSPMSTIAIFVCAITNTDLYQNIKNMLKSGIVPFMFTSVLYFILGLGKDIGKMDISILSVFSDNYNLNIFMILPALVIIILSLLKIDVKIVMFISIITATVLSVVYQGADIIDLLNVYVFGYKAQNAELAKLMDGGGLVSMLKPVIIVLLSSAYFGVFDKTPILKPVKMFVEKFSRRFTVFGSMIFTAIFTSAIACSQALATVLTYQLTIDIQKDKYDHALDIENTAVILPTILPWNIAAAIPLTTIGASNESILFAFFIILLPIYTFIKRIIKRENI